MRDRWLRDERQVDEMRDRWMRDERWAGAQSSTSKRGGGRSERKENDQMNGCENSQTGVNMRSRVWLRGRFLITAAGTRPVDAPLAMYPKDISLTPPTSGG